MESSYFGLVGRSPGSPVACGADGAPDWPIDDIHFPDVFSFFLLTCAIRSMQEGEDLAEEGGHTKRFRRTNVVL